MTFSENKKVEIDARFPGPPDAWGDYLRQHLRANVPVKKKAPAGIYRVIVKFMIDTNGAIINITPETNYGYCIEDELVRIIKKAPAGYRHRRMVKTMWGPTEGSR